MAIADITFGGGSPVLSERPVAGAGSPKAISFDGINMVVATGGGSTKVFVKQQLKQSYIENGTARILENRVS